MEYILMFLLCSASLSDQFPLENGCRKRTGNENEGNQETPKAVRDKKFYCPFSHPSLRNIPEKDSLVNTPIIPELSPNQLKRSLNLKTLYVDQSEGVVSYPSNGSQIRVDATEHVSDYALSLAAETIKRMTQHMPASIFNMCAENTLVGIFTKAESMTVYPEYSYLAPPPGCGTSCEGTCDSQCTFDGRPYSTIAGAGGKRAVVIDDNVICNDEDPYQKKENILVHEYAHTIKSYCLPENLTNSISSAYENAKANGIWTTTDYAMANEDEYWAVATNSIFNSDRFLTGAAGMNRCGDEVCSSEYESSVNIFDKDPDLYALLMEVYFNFDRTVYAGLGTCTKLSELNMYVLVIKLERELKI